MTDENFVRYPAGPGQFLSMLERVGQLGNWHITHAPASWGGRTFTSFGISPDAGTLPDDAAVVFMGGDLPLVKLGPLRFDLLRLFEQGAEWHPKVYTANSFMPSRFKDFFRPAIRGADAGSCYACPGNESRGIGSATPRAGAG